MYNKSDRELNNRTSKGRAFGKCQCGATTAPGVKWCPECAKIEAYGQGTPPQVGHDTNYGLPNPKGPSK